MKISADQIDTKAIAGKTEDGRPVVYVSTKGGLHAFFCKDESGNTCSIGAAPHKAIAQFLAGKKEKITWDSDFKKAERDLIKSEADLFQKLRKVMFMPTVKVGEIESTAADMFVVYDVSKSTIEVVSKSEVQEDIKTGQLSRYALVRDLTMTQPSMCAQDHEDFADLFKE